MIEINNLTTGKVDELFVRKVAEFVLKKEKIRKETGLSLAFIGRGKMRKLNKRYRGKNKSADVLAFPESKVLLEKFQPGPRQKTSNLGEIVICLREVKKNAKRFGFDFEKELTRVLIHGLLHLLGYDHKKDETEAKKMEEKQDYYLTQIFKSQA